MYYIIGDFKMAGKFKERFEKAWNAFLNKDPTEYELTFPEGNSFSYRPDRPVVTKGREKTMINSIVNRISVDASNINIRHVTVDESGRFLQERMSPLNNCLTIEANTDQTGRALIQDIVISMLDEGCVAVVPVDTDGNLFTDNYDILTLRTGKIVEWKPHSVKVRLYDERTGNKKDLLFPKSVVAIIENPFYSIMNEPNSTLQRLIRKLSLLDVADEKTGADRLDLIIQLPYVVKSDGQKKIAEERRSNIENQLMNSKRGIAYTDGTEKITQLNRPIENQLLQHVEYLTNQLYSQLGITTGILDGTADENTMNNYMSRTIEPILTAIVEEFERKFLTKTARTQGQAIRFFRDPFKLVPVNQMAELADKFTRNEIMTSNEIRQAIGMKPAQDPKADELRNSNISASSDEQHIDVNGDLVEENFAPQEEENVEEALPEEGVNDFRDLPLV